MDSLILRSEAIFIHQLTANLRRTKSMIVATKRDRLDFFKRTICVWDQALDAIMPSDLFMRREQKGTALIGG